MLAREVMSRPVITVGVDTPTKEAVQLLDQHGITALPVVDSDDRVVGVVSEVDLLRDALEPDARAHVVPPAEPAEPRAAVVGQVMSPNPLTVTEATDVAEIADMMIMTAVKSVPVVRGGRAVGVVSRSDLIRVIARTDDKIRADVRALLAEVGDRDWQVDVADGVVRLRGPGDEHERRVAFIVARTVPGVARVTFVDGAVPEATAR